MRDQPTREYPPAPTLAEVERIAALDDPVLRNLHITQCYHELANAMARRTGLSANWCTFATWASKQAGQTIRREDLARTVRALVDDLAAAQAAPDVAGAAREFGSPHSDEDIQESVADVLNPLAALARASDAVARGNRKVFEEIGREFARFLAACVDTAAYDDAAIEGFCAALRPGEPPDGQRYLRQAFARYYRAFFEPDDRTRAELMLLANVEIGLHEQTRLQPEIRAAMDAAILDRRQFRARLIRALFPYRGWLARLRLFLLRLIDRPSLFDAALDALWAEAARQLRLALTECVMVITFPPGVRVRLGADLPARFPDTLRELALPDLLALLAAVDRTPDSTRATGAADWSELPERLHFIADLFRSYHESAELFEPPFTPAQVAALKALQRPDGPL